MPRTVTIEQSYTLVNDLYEQITGQKAIAAVDLNTFMAVASGVKALSSNQIAKGLTELLSKMIISVRPYTGFFRLNWNDQSEYGAHIYKVSYLDNGDGEANPTYTLKDGDTIGTHKVKIPKVYEADIWGANTIQVHITITEKQFRTAFDSPSMLARFFNGLMQNIENQIEQQREAMCRTNVLNLAAGVYSFKDTLDEDLMYMKDSTIHLLTEYNAQFGKTYEDMVALKKVPADFTQFAKFAYNRMNRVAKFFGNRDKYFHVNPITDPQCAGTDGLILRHTPASDIRCYICDELLDTIDTQVLTEVRNLEYLKMVKHENVLFWQDVTAPTQVKVNPRVMDKDGSVKAAGPITIDNLFAIMFDKDACGMGIIAEDQGDTPYDVQRHAFNRYWSKEVSSYNDFTEKCAVFVLD